MDGSGDRTYEVTASERAYDGIVASVRMDSVVMPGGETAKREVVEHIGGVGIVAVNAAGEVCLIRQYRHPMGERLWEVPAGLRDVAGEDPRDTAARELDEEASLRAGRLEPLITLATSPGFSTEVVHVFLATDLGDAPKQVREHEEAEIEIDWVPLSTAVERVLSGQIINAIAVAGVLAAARRLGAS